MGIATSAMRNALRTSMPIVQAPTASVTKIQGSRSRPGVVCAARIAATIAPSPKAEPCDRRDSAARPAGRHELLETVDAERAGNADQGRPPGAEGERATEGAEIAHG